MDLIIKNMVCDRCKKVVKVELEKLNLQVKSIELGQVKIKESIDFIRWTLNVLRLTFSQTTPFRMKSN